MTSSNIPHAAFDPLFTDTVVLTRTVDGQRHSRTLAACVFDGLMDDPFGENDTASDRRRANVILRTRDLAGDVPRQRDEVKLLDGQIFRVEKVQTFFSDEFTLECRSI